MGILLSHFYIGAVSFILSSYSYGGYLSLSLPLSLTLSLLLSSYLYGGCLFHTPFPFVRGLPLSLSNILPSYSYGGCPSPSLSLPHSLSIRTGGLPLLLFECMGCLLCSYHSFLLSLFLFIRALDSTITAAIKPILGHILEMNSLT
jgi:hypothetical protein